MKIKNFKITNTFNKFNFTNYTHKILLTNNSQYKNAFLKNSNKISYNKAFQISSFNLHKKFSSKSNSTYDKKFQLDEDFIANYKTKPVNFGFNGLGELVYRRTYSRIKEDGTNEQWHETVKRVVEGTFNMLFDHLHSNNIKINSSFNIDIEKDSQIMYDKIFNFKFLPPGRGLWSMGTSITEVKKIYAALNNCAFVSTKPEDPSNPDEIVKPYIFLMDCAMLGVGVGFDTKAAELNIKINSPNKLQEKYIINDSREGWVESVEILLKSFFAPDTTPFPIFDYSKLRLEGVPLKIFGGISAGPGPLKELHQNLTQVLTSNKNNNLNSRIIVDIMNFIGKSVVAGNIRRTAEIALGEHNDSTFIDLKNYVKNPDRINYGWVSNNSIYAELGMDYEKIVQNIITNGEPGLLWLDNMREYSRMIDSKDNRDRLVTGGNPCLEQSLESFELCCLAETFPNHHENLEDFLSTLRYAFMYAKIVTLGPTHWSETNSVMKRNRRIGVSMTGIIQFLNDKGFNNLKIWSEGGYKFLKEYDKNLSKFLQIPESIKITSIKPSGTVSLLGGATPGLHYPHSRFYIRRVRLGNNSPLIPELIKNGYHVEADVMQKETTSVVSFPIDIGSGVKTINDTNMWEQLSLAAFMQKYWADNQVSCTVTFRKKEAGMIKDALNYFQYQLKGISFLPSFDDEEGEGNSEGTNKIKSKNKTPYPQMPYEEIDESKYNEMLNQIKNVHLSDKIKGMQSEKHDSNFCDSDSCSV